MRIGALRTGWGLALAVLWIGSAATAQPPPAPPPGFPEPITKMPSASPPVLTPSAPPAVRPPAPPPPAGGEAVKEFKELHENHEGHESHHEEEEDKPGAFIIDADFLLWRPLRRNQDYAVVGTNPNFGPSGTIMSVEGKFDPGFRVGAGYRLPGEGWEAVLDYTSFRTTGNNAVSAPDGGFVFPTLTFPGLVTRAQGATANNSITLNVFDLEFAKRWEVGESLMLRGFAGPRIAIVDQKFTALYVGGDVASDAVRRRLEFEGYGIRAGGEASYKLFDHFGVYGRGAVSMLSSRFHSDLSENANGQTVVSASEKFNKMVPVLEMGVGVSYQKGCLRLSAGYEFVNWFGAVEGIDFVDDVSPGKYGRRWADLGFEGLVFRAELMF
jgi:hypothetical protein